MWRSRNQVTGWGESLVAAETEYLKLEHTDLPLTEASAPFPEDPCVKEEDEEAGDSQAWEEPLPWSTEARSLATPRGVEQGLRRRCSKAAAKGPSPSPLWGGGAAAEGLGKQSLFL